MPNTTEKIPSRVQAPLYAAAGAGDIAYEQLRKLPVTVAKLRGRVAELRPVVADKVSEQALRADLDRLREVARRQTAALVSGAQTYQNRAAQAYNGLVARGEQVVRTVRSDTAVVVAPESDQMAVTGTAESTETPRRASKPRGGVASK